MLTSRLLAAWILLMAGLGSRALAAGPAPTDLRCEYSVDPLGIDVTAPRFSWRQDSAGRGAAQTAYQVLVTSADPVVAPGDLWDSGVVHSAQSANVVYAGRKLSSRQRCTWRVRIWDQNGAESELSAPARFELALLEPGDWRADWIGGPPAWPGRALYFRSSFSLSLPVARARLYVSGLGYGEAFINGRKLGDAVLDPAISTTSKRVYYRTFDAAPLLRPGENVLAAIVGSGWESAQMLRAQLEITSADGVRVLVATSRRRDLPAWQVAPGPIVAQSIYGGETYDARLEKPGWDLPGYNPASVLDRTEQWTPPYVVAGPTGRMRAQAIEPIRVMRELATQRVTEPRPGIFVFDFGQNHAGWARLGVQGRKGTQITLRFAEMLAPDGLVDQENLRIAAATDRYILKGQGRESWSPRFTYHGYRYVQVEGWPGRPEPAVLTACVVRSGVAERGEFGCSDETLNRIHRMVQWTERSNLHGVPTDCPQRDERMGWLNDLGARSEELVYNFDALHFLEKFATDIGDAQDPASGAITDTAPFKRGNRPADPVSVSYLLIPELLYQHYGDERVLEKNYDGLRRWEDYLSTRASGNIVSYSYWGDWAPPAREGIADSIGSGAVSAHTPGELISTAFYFYDARLLSGMAATLHRPADEARYRALAEGIRAAFNRSFWNERLGGYGSGNQACDAIALYLDLVPAGRRARVLAALARDVAAADFHLTTGNLCTKYLLEALSAGGRTDLALKIATQTSYPSWGYMLANGATTLWERWERRSGGGMNSYNHPMLGSVGAWLYRWIAGIVVDGPRDGGLHLTFQPPVLAGISSAHAALPTTWGTARIAWRREAQTMRVSLTVPWNCHATVRLPGSATQEITSGTYEYSVALPGASG